jgi:hypothetical protein
MAGQRSRATQMQGGATKAALDNFRAQAGSSGFAGGPEEARLTANISAQGAQNLQNSFTELDWLNEQAKLQQMGIFAPLAGNMASLDASQNIAYLQAQMGRQIPAIPGVTGGGGGAGQFDLLDANGRLINFNPDGTPLTPEQRQRQMQQRQLWVQMNPGA